MAGSVAAAAFKPLVSSRRDRAVQRQHVAPCRRNMRVRAAAATEVRPSRVMGAAVLQLRANNVGQCKGEAPAEAVGATRTPARLLAAAPAMPALVAPSSPAMVTPVHCPCCPCWHWFCLQQEEVPIRRRAPYVTKQPCGPVDFAVPGGWVCVCVWWGAARLASVGIVCVWRGRGRGVARWGGVGWGGVGGGETAALCRLHWPSGPLLSVPTLGARAVGALESHRVAAAAASAAAVVAAGACSARGTCAPCGTSLLLPLRST